MKKFTLFTDVVFISFCVFLFSYALTRFFLPYAVSLVASATFSALFSLLLVKIFLERLRKTKSVKTEQKAFTETCFELDFMNSAEVKKLFESVFVKKGFTAVKRKKYLYLPQKNMLVFIKFGFEKITKTDIVAAYNSLGDNESLTLISSDYTEEITNFAQKFNKKIRLYDSKAAYKLLKETDSLPELKHNSFYAEQKPEMKLKNIFRKKHAKRFLLLGAYFTVFSFFVSVKLYYVIAGGIFLLLSAALRFFGKSDVAEQEF